MRAQRRIIEVLYPGKDLGSLQGFPGTEVWQGETWQYLGSFNHEGRFVAFMSTLN